MAVVQIRCLEAPLNRYDFRAVSNWRDSKDQPSLNFKLPDSGPEEAFQLRLEGQGREISFKFDLYDDGNDTSDGQPGGIITIEEQYNHKIGQDNNQYPSGPACFPCFVSFNSFVSFFNFLNLCF